MKRFIKFYHKDKQNFKMINQSDKGFELVILSDALLKNILETINDCEEKSDDVDIVWQMKHKQQNYIVYKNCTFSAPMDNVIPEKWTYGFKKNEINVCKKIKVSCSGTSYYSDSSSFKNKNIKKTKNTYKDGMLLERMLKLGELNYISEKE
jgi:hypothetical protein